MMESEHFPLAGRATGDAVSWFGSETCHSHLGVWEASALLPSVGISACTALVVMFGLLQEGKKLLRFA